LGTNTSKNFGGRALFRPTELLQISSKREEKGVERKRRRERQMGKFAPLILRD